ncbi:hypothetical protein AVEN_119498-1 [Araneus ventricosus]|uniref:YitH/HolE acetyltransferase (GNAT) domain-containing protein n=2 Tax=Araneus ventricosus TaxID=182803 RepID=A0A4Y2DUY8_ARAVE|nr:hypothetical protein AVEN_119498-1 [Araneus ventricosus]
MKRVGDRNAGVNPVPEQLENYRDRSGFLVQTSWCSVVANTKSMDMALFAANDLDINVQRLTLKDNDTLNNVICYDADVCGFSRGNLVPLLCNQKDSATIVATKADSDEICGYGNIRKNIKNGAIVGPLYADSAEIAERILYELLKAFPIGEVEGIIMMAIDCNLLAMKMMDKLGFQSGNGIARLYRKEEVHVKYEKVFSQHSLNFSIF